VRRARRRRRRRGDGRRSCSAGAYRDKFGGDHIDDVREAVERYEDRIGWKRRAAPGRDAQTAPFVITGFMGRGSRPRRRGRRGARGPSRSTPTRL
jgi:hypothetical protein